MKKGRFQRSDSLFSLCGLNCGLCPMYIRGDLLPAIDVNSLCALSHVHPGRLRRLFYGQSFVLRR